MQGVSYVKPHARKGKPVQGHMRKLKGRKKGVFGFMGDSAQIRSAKNIGARNLLQSEKDNLKKGITGLEYGNKTELMRKALKFVNPESGSYNTQYRVKGGYGAYSPGAGICGKKKCGKKTVRTVRKQEVEKIKQY